jgi:GMP synthase-like glutamine amidotransferase
MKVAIFQHIASEPAGLFETVFSERGIPYEYIRLYETGEIPAAAAGATHYLFMGGPMSVNDEKELPYLIEEKAMIRDAVHRGRPVLGVCLGAQLIASAFGARVYPYRQETGWCQLARTPDAPGIFSRFPDRFPVFQLHGETFDLPPGACLSSTGTTVKHQAFVYKTATALQFHLELTEGIIRDWIRDLDPAQQEAIQKDTPAFIGESNRLCRLVAGVFLA